MSRFYRITACTLAVMMLASPAALAASKKPAADKPATSAQPEMQSVRKLSDYMMAGYDFSLYSALDPSAGIANVDGAVRQAWADYRAGKTASTTMTLSNYLEKSPDDVVGHYVLAHVYEAHGDFGGATQQLELAVGQNPAFMPAYLRLIPLYLQANNVTAAGAMVAKARTQWPKQADFAMYQGQVLAAEGNFPMAEQAFLQALQLDPYRPEMHYQMALFELKRNNAAAAETELKTMLALAPDDVRGLKALAEVYRASNKTAEAEKLYARLLDPAMLISHARNLQQANRPEDALAALRTAETLATVNTFDLAMVYADLDKAQAKRLLQEFVNSAPKSDNRVTLAKARLQQLETASTEQPSLGSQEKQELQNPQHLPIETHVPRVHTETPVETAAPAQPAAQLDTAPPPEAQTAQPAVQEAAPVN